MKKVMPIFGIHLEAIKMRVLVKEPQHPSDEFDTAVCHEAATRDTQLDFGCIPGQT